MASKGDLPRWMQTGQLWRRSGAVIYGIECLVNHRVYVGQSAGVGARWAGHLAKLPHEDATGNAFAADWQRYGETAFVFRILERVLKPGSVPACVSMPHDRYITYLEKVGMRICAREAAWITAYGALAYNKMDSSYRVGDIRVKAPPRSKRLRRIVPQGPVWVSNPTGVLQEPLPCYPQVLTESRDHARHRLAQTLAETVRQAVLHDVGDTFQ